jgi:hypothetical protein
MVGNESAQSIQANANQLTEKEAAFTLGVEPITMRMWRYRDKLAETAGRQHYVRKAPPWRKLPSGGIRYPYDQLMAWLQALPLVNGVPVLPDGRRRPDPIEPAEPAEDSTSARDPGEPVTAAA